MGGTFFVFLFSVVFSVVFLVLCFLLVFFFCLLFSLVLVRFFKNWALLKYLLGTIFSGILKRILVRGPWGCSWFYIRGNEGGTAVFLAGF